MPNWVYGQYAIKGTKRNVLAFLNEGLGNSGLAPRRKCESAFKCLKENAKTKESRFAYSEDGAGNKLTVPAAIVYEDRLTLDTFRPMPDTFKLYDTTNCAKDMPEIAKEQEQLYGCVGWYDWGIKYRGTKWNTGLNEAELFVDDKTATLKFECSTAWNYPDEWLRWVKNTFRVAVLLCVSEESGAFDFYGSLDEERIDMACSGGPKQEDFESEDDYWDALYDYTEECRNSMCSDFADYVAEYEV
jgi:hypothetical protein